MLTVLILILSFFVKLSQSCNVTTEIKTHCLDHHVCDALSLRFSLNGLKYSKNLTRVTNDDTIAVHRVLFSVDESCLDFYQDNSGYLPTIVSKCNNSIAGFIEANGSTYETYSKENGEQCTTELSHDMTDSRDKALKYADYGPLTPVPGRRYLELVIVNDKRLFERFNSSKAGVIAYNKRIASIVNIAYAKLDIHVVLKKVIIWSNWDKIELANNTSHQLSMFADYANNILRITEKFDVAHLLTGNYYSDTTVGEAYRGTVCAKNSVGVVVHMDTEFEARPLSQVAETFAHEIGHNLGFRHDAKHGHDNETQCSCRRKDKKCLMWPIHKNIAWDWSNCSRAMLDELTLDGLLRCLINKPLVDKNTEPICGNGIVESGEECDCAPFDEECRKCCKWSNCTLIDKARCSAGECCTNCQVVTRRKICRYHVGECDRDEVCDGESEFCPLPDIKEDNGKECHSFEKEGYCFNGHCESHDDQCRLLFGVTSTYSDSCRTLMHHNVRGDAAGNCGVRDFDKGRYKACQLEDVNCGQLHCKWREYGHLDKSWIGDRLRHFGRYRFGSWSRYTNTSGEFSCFGVNYKSSANYKDYGLVAEGTKCGDQKWCLNQKCVPVSNSSNHGSGHFTKVLVISAVVALLILIALISFVALIGKFLFVYFSRNDSQNAFNLRSVFQS